MEYGLKTIDLAWRWQTYLTESLLLDTISIVIVLKNFKLFADILKIQKDPGF